MLSKIKKIIEAVFGWNIRVKRNMSNEITNQIILTLTLLSADAALHCTALSWWTFGLWWPSLRLGLDNSKYEDLISALALLLLFKTCFVSTLELILIDCLRCGFSVAELPTLEFVTLRFSTPFDVVETRNARSRSPVEHSRICPRFRSRLSSGWGLQLWSKICWRDVSSRATSLTSRRMASQSSQCRCRRSRVQWRNRWRKILSSTCVKKKPSFRPTWRKWPEWCRHCCRYNSFSHRQALRRL